MAGLDGELRALVDELLRRWWAAVPPGERDGAAGVYLKAEHDEYRRRAALLAQAVGQVRARLDEAREEAYEVQTEALTALLFRDVDRAEAVLGKAPA